MKWEWRTGIKLKYLTIPKWDELGVQIGFSNRENGVSNYPYESLNLGLHVGDDSNKVLENRQRWYSEWKATANETVIAQQIHGTKVHWVKPEDAGKGSREIETAICNTDAMITDTTLALMAFFADCVPVFIFNPKIGIVGIIHAGWKGTVGNIVNETIKSISLFGGRPEDCLAAIGPSIGPCCYEIDEYVAEKVKEMAKDTVLESRKNGKYMLDLWTLNKLQLVESGVQEHNIALSAFCTSCNSEDFFSYRRDGGQTGRMCGWIRRKHA